MLEVSLGTAVASVTAALRAAAWPTAPLTAAADCDNRVGVDGELGARVDAFDDCQGIPDRPTDTVPYVRAFVDWY